MIKGFESAAAAKGYDLFLCTTNYNVHRMEAAVRKMIENGVRGVAIMTSSATEEVAQQLALRQIAVVVIDLEMALRHVGSISVDYYAGVSQAVEHLAQLGHERLAFIAGPSERRSARRYRETVLKSVHERKMKLQQIVDPTKRLKGGELQCKKCGRHATSHGVNLHQRSDCHRSYNCIARDGCASPRTGVGGGLRRLFYMAQFVNPPLTTVKLDRKRLGKMAFDALERMSRSKQRKGTAGVLETQLVIRSSTAARNPKLAIWNRA